MKIGIVISANQASGGIYQYTSCILESLYNWDTPHDFIIYAWPNNCLPLNQFSGPHWEIVTLDPKMKNSVHRNNFLAGDGLELSRRGFNEHAESFFEKHPTDLMIFPAPVNYAFEWDIPYIVAVHDLQHRLHPEFPEVSAGSLWNSREFLFRNAIKYAQSVLVDSEVGKEDLLDGYQKYIQAHQVYPLPFVPFYRPQNEKYNEFNITKIRNKYTLPENFLFYPAQFWMHKNHQRLIHAIQLLKCVYGLEIALVLVGANSGGPKEEARGMVYRHAMALADQLGVKDLVYHLGYVPDEEMPALYQMASALTMPTFFGPTNIPVLEAWAFGCPVISSDIRGIREQIGAAGMLVNPENAHDIANGIYKVMTDTSLQKFLIKSGYERLASYSLNDFSCRLHEIIDNAGEQTNSSQSSILLGKQENDSANECSGNVRPVRARPCDELRRGESAKKIALYFYSLHKDFVMSPKYCSGIVPLLLGTEAEQQYRIHPNDINPRFISSSGWVMDSKSNRNGNREVLFDIVEDPDDSDFIVFPYTIDGLIEDHGIRGTLNFFKILPYFKRHEEKHVFFTFHDSSDRFHITSLFFRASVNKKNRDRNTIPFPYPVDNFFELVSENHLNNFQNISYDSSFVGYLGSSKLRTAIVRSVSDCREINAFIDTVDKFYGHMNKHERDRRKKIFIDAMVNSFSVLCPRGTGENTFRFFETLSVGRIPILISDTCALPLEDEIDYDNFMLRIPENKVEASGDILVSWIRSQSPEDLMQKCCKARNVWETYFQSSQWNYLISRMLQERLFRSDFESAESAADTSAVDVPRTPSTSIPPYIELTGTPDLGKCQDNDITAYVNQNDFLVSAIVSTYNAQRFIRGCIEDLENQTIADRLEIIIIDSGSQQNERGIVEEMQQQYENIRYIRTDERESVYCAWNRGIKIASGKYITNANTDDRHRKDALERMVNLLEMRSDVALVYADVLKTDTENETFEQCHPVGEFRWYDWDRDILLKKGCFIGPQPMWRRSVHHEYGWFDEALVTSGDYEFWLRISQSCNFYHIRMLLGLYLARPDSIEHRDIKVKRSEDMKIRSAYMDAAVRGIIIGNPKISSLNPMIGNNNSNSHKLTIGENTAKTPHGYRLNQIESEPINQGGINVKDFEIVYQAIQPLFNSSRIEDALAALENFVSSCPSFARAHHDLGTLYYQRNEKEKALAQFQFATQIEPENVEFKKSLADFYYVEQNRIEEALRLYQEIIAVGPLTAETLLTAGHLCLALQRFDDAKKIYERILKVQPDNVEARQYLEKMPRIQKTSPDPTIFGYGQTPARVPLNEKLSRKDITELEQKIRINPDDALAHNDLGVLYYRAGEKEKAFKHYQQSAKLAPANIVFQKNLADFYFVEKGMIEEALKIYVNVLTLEPEDIETLQITGQICVSLDKFEDAKVFFNRILEIEPWNLEAREILDKLQALGQESIEEKSPGEIYHEIQAGMAGQDPQAVIEAFEKLSAAAPDFAPAHNDLGVLYYQSGEKDKALTHYERAAHLEPGSAVFQKNLADYYFVEQGRVEDALKIYVDVLAAYPEDIETLLITGHICVSLRKFDDARVFYNRVLELEPWNADAGQNLDKLDGFREAVRF